jgi:hypothetical protein
VIDTRCPELVGPVCLVAPCHVRAGLRARLDPGERLVLQCAVCGWPVLVLALRCQAPAGLGDMAVTAVLDACPGPHGGCEGGQR